MEVGLGVALWQRRHVSNFHVFYGFIAIAAVAIIYAYRVELRRYRYLLYGLGGFFLMGLGIRAMILSHPGAR